MSDANRPLAVYLLAHTPYPPVSGGARRAAHIAEVLAEWYDVLLLAVDERSAASPTWAGAADRLLARRRSKLALVRDTVEGIALGRHVLLQRSIRAGVLSAFVDLLAARRPELVVLGRPLVGPFLEAAVAAGVTVVVDADESLPRVAWGIARSRYATWPQRVRAVIEAVFVVGRMERASYPKASQVWVASDLERASFARFVPEARIAVIPNVMDVPAEAPVANPVAAIAFVGSYFYPPNEAAALELIARIGPAVRARGAQLKVVLIGPSASRALQAAAAKDPNVDLLGEVPDVKVPLRQAGVLAVPMRAGGGTRVKILEAMAAGVPVVTTALGVEGMNVSAGNEVLIAESAHEFAVQIGRLVGDSNLRAQLVQNGFDFVRARHTKGMLLIALASALHRADRGSRDG